MSRSGQFRSFCVLLSTAGFVSLMAGLPAQAAEGGPQIAQAETDYQVEEIVVTARRRTETGQTAPVAVTAVTGRTLEAFGATTLADVKTLAPNVVIDQITSGPSAAAIAIRGISFEDIEKSFDPAVGVLVDGVYLGTNTGQLAHNFDFESVEVLRGPQGTLFGRNTPGGVINVRRTRPTGELGANLAVTFGNYGRKEYNAVVNLPSPGDKLATKLFFTRAESDGFAENVTKGRNEGRGEYTNFGATFLFTPTDNFDALITFEKTEENGDTWNASLSRTDADLICVFGAPANQCNRNNKEDLYTTFGSGNNDFSSGAYSVTGELNWDLGGVKLTSLTNYTKSKENQFQDFDATTVDFYHTNRQQHYQQFSQELRAAGEIGPKINYVAGAYYFRSAYSNDQVTDLFFIATRLNPIATQSSRSIAVFGDIDWQFLPKWRLSVGARYTLDRKTADLIEYTPGPGGFVVFDTTGLGTHKAWSGFTPAASIDYRPNDEIMIYARYAKGYRAGGFSGRAASLEAAVTPYNPEKVNSYEVGTKTEWFDKRLRVNVAGFTTKYSDKQEEIVVAGPISGTNQTLIVNAATARIWGAELEFQAIPVHGFTITGTFGWLNGYYHHFFQGNPLIDTKDLKLRRQPHLSGTIGFSYKHEPDFGDWTLASSYNYISSYAQTIVSWPNDPLSGTGANPNLNDPRCNSDVQHNVSASLGWEHEAGPGTVHATLFGRNLLDDRGLNACLPVVGLWTFASGRAPRTFGVTVGYRF